MNDDLIFPDGSYTKLADSLLSSYDESCAIILAGYATHMGRSRLLVREIHEAPSDAYQTRNSIAAELKPEFIAPFVKRAKKSNASLIFAHTHPGDSKRPVFSAIDDRGEHALAKFLAHRHLKGPHAALVISPGGCAARLIPGGTPLHIVEVGKQLRYHSELSDGPTNEKLFDRQIRAFGKTGQDVLRGLKIGIVGLGGTGSVVAQQLAYLGVRQFLLIDFDVADVTNLNRLVGASQSQLNIPKTTIAADNIRRIVPESDIDAIIGSVLDDSTAKRLLECDFLFGCTDNHGSRAVVQHIVYQYYIPCIDMGVVITAEKGKVTHIAGRVQMLSPGLPCLTCGNLLDAGAVRFDLMTADQRAADPYFMGHLAEPQPAVISLNSTIASLAVTMFLGAVTDVPVHPRFQTYNAMSGNVRTVAFFPDPMCVVSSENGVLGRGDEWPLPTRKMIDAFNS